MIDVLVQANGLDLGVYDTQVERAKNILSVQLRALEYAQELGIDLKYFLTENYKFQNDSFRAYLIEVLANWGINVASVIEDEKTLYTQMIFNLTPEDVSSGFVAR